MRYYYFSAPNFLTCDLDGAASVRRFREVIHTIVHKPENVWGLQRAEADLAYKWWHLARSTRKGHWHGFLQLDNQWLGSEAERYALQAMLGSDPYREAYSLAQINTGHLVRSWLVSYTRYGMPRKPDVFCRCHRRARCAHMQALRYAGSMGARYRFDVLAGTSAPERPRFTWKDLAE